MGNMYLQVNVTESKHFMAQSAPSQQMESSFAQVFQS